MLFTDTYSWKPVYPKWGCSPNPFILRNLSLQWIFNSPSGSCLFNSCIQPCVELGITGLSRNRSPLRHNPKGRYLMKVGLHWARAWTWTFLNPHGDRFMLWNAKITTYSIKTATDSWPASGNHVLSLCKSNHAQSKGPSGPFCYRKEKPTFYRHWLEKNEIFKFHPKKNIQHCFSQNFFSPFSKYSFK